MCRAREPRNLLSYVTTMLETNLETLSNGYRVRVARLGAAHGKRPPLVFLHGYPDNLQIWSELATSMPNGFQVIAFDWPGMGYSDDWKDGRGSVTPILMAERLLVLLDEWGIERATVIGIDVGGQPALVFGSKYPERVERLVVMNCLAFPNEKTSWEISLLRKLNLNRILLGIFPGFVFKRVEHTFLPKGMRLPSELREDLWGAFRQPTVRKFITRLSAGYQATLPGLPDLYRAITCPTLVLWGGEDKHFPPAHGRRLHDSIKRSHLHIISAGQHWMPWHLQGEVARRVADFAS